MGVVDGFKGAGIFSKVALILLIIAVLFAWISYTCTGWGRTDNGVANADTHIGLWRICSDNQYTPGCNPTDGWANDWFAATQALVSIGFFGCNVGLFLLILYMFVPSCLKNGEVAIATAIICILTGVIYMIGVIVFGAKFQEDFIDPRDNNSAWPIYEFGYAFGLSIVAFLFEIVAGVLVLVDSKKGGTSPSA